MFEEQYEIIEPIDEGAFGEVYKIKEKSSNDIYALKKIRIKNNNSQIIEKEIQMLLIMMKSQYSVKLFDSFSDKYYYYLILELCDGTIEEEVGKEKGFKIIKIKEVMRQLNEAFKLMRRHKLIHRDLKPANILIKRTSQTSFDVRLSDYGFMRKLNSFSNPISHPGTKITQAPEVIFNKDYDEKADLWSIGVIIYFLYFNEYPFNENNFVLFIQSIINGKIPKINLPENEELKSLIISLLEVDPNKRISWDDYFIHTFFKEDIESLNEKVNRINLNNSSVFSNINPFEIIGKKENEINEFELNYCYFKDSPNEKKFLSYYILNNKNKFNRTGNIFNVKIKDHFYYVVINDLINLKNLYEKNKYIIAEKDENGYTLLHYSVIGGYYELTEFLLNKGINYDEPTNGDRPVTPLYYAKGKIKKLLIKNGSRIPQYNAVKEMFPTGIFIQYKDFNTIESIHKQFLSKGIVNSIKKIEKDGKIIGIRLIRNQKRGRINVEEYEKWEKVYHGTRFVSIESILSHGLRYFRRTFNLSYSIRRKN